MPMAKLPQTIYTTQRKFNDYGTDDMRYGDIAAARLKNEFRLISVSNVVDPYTLTRLTAFNNPQSRFAGVYGNQRRGGVVSVQECAQLLFDEMQVTSLPYAFVGSYKYLINKMLRHFQQSTGAPFTDMQLNAAYKSRIFSENKFDSTRSTIYQMINNYVDYDRRGYPQRRIPEITELINARVLPKFNSLIMDKINGMGITIHDVHATRIEILRLDVKQNRWRAEVKFSAQDHFGLDVDDIRKLRFYQFQFFRIWFILQRYDRFGFQPFFTNLEATIDMEGGR
ncbi:hypothetical protein CLM71_11710 [Serratia sp. MYb239]|uniref:DUF3289 family protein n=1 Tax=Serratia sp. MYb239 TaxID=2033438 RepID=UPI000CF70903|nr:DUF3289 family protein [Serratia sp. MYb239]AVJ17751.1 hypothetical protein CLM71_11710 [Serratia sp. MYb239]SQJ19503.1 Protein of uncharacterised function (DUF3289) [Serratia rubidaea]